MAEAPELCVECGRTVVDGDIADGHKRERDRLLAAAKGYFEWLAGEDASFEAEAKAEGALRAAIAECGED